MKKALLASTAFSLAGLLTISSLLSPVTAAYAANSVQAMDVTSVVVPVDDGVASRDEVPADGDAAVIQSPSADVGESADGVFGIDASIAEQQEDSIDSAFQYVYLAYPSLPGGTNQVVAFATPDDGDTLASATLNYVSANGVQGTIDASETADNSAAFVFGSTLKSNTYFLISITYVLSGDDTKHVVDLSDRDYSFTVIDGSMSSEGTSVYYADGDGYAVEAQSIQQALECADSPDGISTYAERSARNVKVIALDAGHGGVDSGAQGNGKSEADLTWKIMTACKNKLEAYGFKVVLAREQSGYYPSNDYLYRVQRCIDQGAQAFVSFHINSGSSGAHGAEVYAPTANGTDYTQVSVELASKVMNNLAAMGLTYRGVFQMEVGDEFAVIRCAREQGIPGILIEHGFISNYGDVANYFSDDGCRRLGEADAAAIIAQFPKSNWFSGTLSVNKQKQRLNLSLAYSGPNPTNASFMVTSPSGKVDWVQAYDQKNKTWSALQDLDEPYGVTEASVYVTVDGETFCADKKVFGDNSCNLTIDTSNRKIFVKSSDWAVNPTNVAIQIIGEDGSSSWFQANRQQDQWDVELELDDLNSVFGNHELIIWCDLNGVDSFSCGQSSFKVSRPEVKLDLGTGSGALSASASGFTAEPSNAAFQVVSPSGSVRWYQANRGPDGSWSASIAAAADFGEFGPYAVHVWATYGSRTERWASARAEVSRPEVKLDLGTGSGALSASASGFTAEPSNAAFQVVSPSGSVRWYQANRGPDGSWSASIAAAADFGEAGVYSVSIWATFGSFNSRFTADSIYCDAVKIPISSISNSSASKMADLFNSRSNFPSHIYEKYGAADINQFCSLVYKESMAEGVNPDVVFAQAMIETGWLSFGGQVSADQCNFAGIGALDSGVSGASFNSFGHNSVQMGIRAQVQHLKAYSSYNPLNNDCIDPRFSLVCRGSAPFVEDLSGKWASDPLYGRKIRNLLDTLYQLN